MNDLPSRLRKYYVNGKEWYGIEIDVLTEAADHIEAQEKLIEELERRNRELNAELGGVRRSYFDERKKVITLSKASKSNPNTQERNDE